MKLLNVIRKNFKLLLRSKASAFIVLLGPLLVVLLVGVVFSGKTSYELSIGYTTPVEDSMTLRFVNALKESDFYVHKFASETECTEKIKQGVIHTCIVFPKDFSLNNSRSTELRFLVDYSRMNLVYTVINSVSSILEIQTKELSFSLTEVLLSRINSTMADISSDLAYVDAMNPKLAALKSEADLARRNVDSMRLDTGYINLTDVVAKAQALNESVIRLASLSGRLVNESQDLLDELHGYIGANASAALQEDIDDLANESTSLGNVSKINTGKLFASILALSNSIDNLKSDLAISKSINDETRRRIDAIQNTVSTVQAGFLIFKNNLEGTKEMLESISITNAETIVSPVNTRIEPIISENSNLAFTFPFLLVLVIMFVALLLSSTLIIFEKNSRASFRNFVSPTRPSLFVTATFITAMIVIIVQTVIILLLASYFLKLSLANNVVMTLFILLLTSALFVVIGMVVGYMFTTQEAAVMSSIVVGAVFMFLSNLVVPLESLAPALSGAIKFNPYVMSSELLRKSLLFKIGFGDAALVLGIEAAVVFIVLSLILLVQGMGRRRKIHPVSGDAAIEETEFEDAGVPSFAVGRKPFSSKAGSATTRKELLAVILNMTQSEFQEAVLSHEENTIADWVETELSDKKLGAKLRRALSKKDTVAILEEDVKHRK